jgi:hypothetical protein
MNQPESPGRRTRAAALVIAGLLGCGGLLFQAAVAAAD